jgi:hypothetical protein
MAVTQAEDMLR